MNRPQFHTPVDTSVNDTSDSDQSAASLDGWSGRIACHLVTLAATTTCWNRTLARKLARELGLARGQYAVIVANDYDDEADAEHIAETLGELRKRNGVPDYAAIGCELETAGADDLLAFTRKFCGTTDGAMAALVTFATFTLSARNARLKGDIEGALMFERNAETVYLRDIKPGNRW